MARLLTRADEIHRQLPLRQREVRNLATYTFNQHVIKHRFCPKCGIHPYGEGKDPKGNAMAAINLRCLEDFDLEAVKVTHYDGRGK